MPVGLVTVHRIPSIVASEHIGREPRTVCIAQFIDVLFQGLQLYHGRLPYNRDFRQIRFRKAKSLYLFSFPQIALVSITVLHIFQIYLCAS